MEAPEACAVEVGLSAGEQAFGLCSTAWSVAALSAAGWGNAGGERRDSWLLRPSCAPAASFACGRRVLSLSVLSSVFHDQRRKVSASACAAPLSTQSLSQHSY